MMMINLIPFLFNIIVFLLLLPLVNLMLLLLLITIAGASAANRGNGQPAARRTAAERAYAGGQLFISVYDILCTLYIYIYCILQGGHLCLREQ